MLFLEPFISSLLSSGGLVVFMVGLVGGEDEVGLTLPERSLVTHARLLSPRTIGTVRTAADTLKPRFKAQLVL